MGNCNVGPRIPLSRGECRYLKISLHIQLKCAISKEEKFYPPTMAKSEIVSQFMCNNNICTSYGAKWPLKIDMQEILGLEHRWRDILSNLSTFGKESRIYKLCYSVVSNDLARCLYSVPVTQIACLRKILDEYVDMV